MAKGRNTAADDDSDIEEVPQNGADGDSEGEEYEIEAILDAKPGIFEEVCTTAWTCSPLARLTAGHDFTRCRASTATSSSGRATAKTKTAGWHRRTPREPRSRLSVASLTRFSPA